MASPFTALINKKAITYIPVIAFELLGSLSYFMRGNLSYLAGFIIGAISYYIKDFWGLERDFLAEY